MLDDVILRVLVAGFGVAIVAGALGCFVVWRRMAYFGDSLAHSALLGVALGLIYGFSTNLGTLIVCLAFAVLLIWLQQKRFLATDTLLGILAHAALSIGMVVISFLDRADFDLHDYLFGDIMGVTQTNLYWILFGTIIILGLLLTNWQSLMLMTIDEDLAKAENVNTFWIHLLLLFLLTIVVAISIRVVGILLITSLLIIPAATARQFTRSPETMAIMAVVFGVIAVAIGIFGSVQLGTPAGPSIVTIAAIMFAVLLPVSLLGQFFSKQTR